MAWAGLAGQGGGHRDHGRVELGWRHNLAGQPDVKGFRGTQWPAGHANLAHQPLRQGAQQDRPDR